MTLTNREPCLASPTSLLSAAWEWQWHLPSPHSLPLRGGSPQNYANSPIPVGGSSVRLERDFSMLSDSSHDKISLPLHTCALDLRLLFEDWTCQIHAHTLSKRLRRMLARSRSINLNILAQNTALQTCIKSCLCLPLK